MTEFELKVAVAEIVNEIKHIAKKIDQIDERMKKYDITHDKMIVLETELKDLKYDFDKIEQPDNMKTGAISVGSAGVILALVEVIKSLI